MYDGVRRLSVLLIVCCVALMATYWLRGGSDYSIFHLVRGEVAPVETVPVVRETFTPAEGSPVEPESTSFLQQLDRQQIALAEAVSESVVSITTAKRVRFASVADHPQDERIQFHEAMVPERGSGVIVSYEGHVMTNYHVIKGAASEDIEVMSKGGTRYKASVIGFDKVADIALLRLFGGAEETFKPLKFADSDQVRQGQMVFALGNPFGLHETFTDGTISSSMPRQVNDYTPPLLQTNTVINPGNSGGPLFDVRGDIVGINWAIYKGQDDVDVWQGFGLAIPANVANRAKENILNQGVPQYGYLGVSLHERPPHMKGCLIYATVAGSPAEAAGLESNDVILSYGGHHFQSRHELISLIQRTPIGKEVRIKILRDEQPLAMSATIRDKESVTIPQPSPELTSKAWERAGLEVRYVQEFEKRRMGLDSFAPCVMVTKVQASSPAAEAGLHTGYLIRRLDEQPLKTPKAFYALLSDSEAAAVTLNVHTLDGSLVDLRLPIR